MAKVLLVEDDNALREIFEMRLQAEGYQTVTASDGEEGLTVAVKEKPDLVIADVMMPKLSGFEMVENLKAAPEMKDVKIIMMTALGQDEDRSRGEKLGVVKYLVKSQVTLEDFARVVKEVLGPSSGPAPAAAPESDSSTTNKIESESSMQEDQTPTNAPAADAPADNGAAGTNPISGTPPTDGSAGSVQQTSAQEQGMVQDQINNFVSSTPADSGAAADTAAPADSGAASAPAEPSADGTDTGAAPYVPPATPPPADAPQPPAGDSGEQTPPAAPTGDAGGNAI